MSTDEDILLKTSFGKHIFLILICLAFVGGGIWMINSGDWRGWLPTIFFGAGAPLIIMQAVMGSGYIRLNQEGMTMGSVRGTETTIKWQEIEEFGIWEISGNKFVSWNFVADYKASKKIRDFNKGLGAMDSMLPDNYGMKPAELLALLEEFKMRHS